MMILWQTEEFKSVVVTIVRPVAKNYLEAKKKERNGRIW